MNDKDRKERRPLSAGERDRQEARLLPGSPQGSGSLSAGESARRTLIQSAGFTLLSALTVPGIAATTPKETDTTMASDALTNEERERLTADNLAAATRYAAAWKAGDFAAIRNCYHDEITLHYFGNHSLAGDHVGKAASLQALGEISRRARRQLVEIVDITAGPRRVALVVKERFERDGEQAVLLRVLVYTIKEGLLHECWVFDADQARMDRFLR